MPELIKRPTLEVWTGGQTGVDTGALLAVIAAGGAKPNVLFPKDFRREEPDKGKIDAKKLAKLVTDAGGNAYCTDTTNYEHRTRECIRRTQALLIITPDLDSSPGTRLTYRVASDAGHQLWLFRTINDKALWKAEGHAIGYWLKSLLPHWRTDGRDGINLMVAGPRESKWPDAEKISGEIMTHVLEELNSR
jgi:hypothetical protein